MLGRPAGIALLDSVAAGSNVAPYAVYVDLAVADTLLLELDPPHLLPTPAGEPVSVRGLSWMPELLSEQYTPAQSTRVRESLVGRQGLRG